MPSTHKKHLLTLHNVTNSHPWIIKWVDWWVPDYLSQLSHLSSEVSADGCLQGLPITSVKTFLTTCDKKEKDKKLNFHEANQGYYLMVVLAE